MRPSPRSPQGRSRLYEDERISYPLNDQDFNDLMVAIQFIRGEAAVVPEPSTYGLIGAATLLGLIGYRRLKNRAAAKTVTPK